MGILILVSVIFLVKSSEGAVDLVLDQCCMTGSDWAADGNQRCDSYPSAVDGVPPEAQRECRAILEVCCMKAKQRQQCDRGHQDALEYPACTSRNVFGAEQYLECCHCCHLGLAQRQMGGDCTYLSDVNFGGPCDRKFQECCNGRVNKTVENDIDECELHPGVLCSHECVNTIGSYRCECEPGYTLHSDASTCILDNSGINCSVYNPCEHRCIDDTNGVRCECNQGYELDEDGVSCRDVDECTSGAANCIGDTQCLNTEGGFSCEPVAPPVSQCPDGTTYDETSGECQPSVSCDQGYAYNTVSQACDDLDECTVFLHNCYGAHMLCINSPGSFTCRCEDGFNYHNSSMTCQDIDECAQNGLNTCLTTQRCENTIGSYRCGRILGCGTGYTLDADTQRCVDRDECALRIDNCELGYNCVNLQGSFRCVPTQCQFGYRFSSSSGRCEPINCRRGLEPNRRGSCVDINECERDNRCRPNQICKNTYGSYRCRNKVECQAGHEMDQFTQVCVDIDECSRNLDDCKDNQECINRPGSFICNCQRGYRVGMDGNCEDINECNDPFVCPFDSVCENTQGSYRCGCNEGLRSEGRRCVDVNECEDPNICQYRCMNVYGSYHCQCRTGYQLAADKRSCEDIDECTKFGGRHRLCGGNCVNTPGSYRCECPDGWTSYGRGQACRDIDECQQRPGICGADRMCFNTKGSYKCPYVVCPPGFAKTMLGPRRNRAGRLKAEEGIMCNRRTCNITDTACRTSKVRSITYQFVALPTVKSLLQPVELLNVQTVSYLLIPNLKFHIIRGNEEGLFEAVTTGNSAALNLIKPVIGPAEYELVLRLENWNILGNQLFSVYLTHVMVDVSASDWS
ncbi:fibulin-1-like isoform X5 [Argopecten irradians]|uniref:fibulin-1-like isoform X5 n=1 Tax=Argopecten irradians TaxID=31199 RepID=UPI0037106D8D